VADRVEGHFQGQHAAQQLVRNPQLEKEGGIHPQQWGGGVECINEMYNSAPRSDVLLSSGKT
jgi:hypothetical protein